MRRDKRRENWKRVCLFQNIWFRMWWVSHGTTKSIELTHLREILLGRKPSKERERERETEEES